MMIRPIRRNLRSEKWRPIPFGRIAFAFFNLGSVIYLFSTFACLRTLVILDAMAAKQYMLISVEPRFPYEYESST